MNFSAQLKAFALLLSVGLVAGCSSTGGTSEEGGEYGSDVAAVDQEGGSTVYGGDDQGGVSSSAMTEEERMAAREQAEQQALREITVFYFDFDTAEIKQEARDVLVAHARFLANNPGQNVRIEGHADERGTKEYNLALGERRAMAVRRFLMANGASSSQMKVVSFGEERPAVMGSSAESYAKNRRVEVKYQSK